LELNNNKFKIPESYEFKESFPWIGGDLQTIRDSLCINFKFSKNIEKILIPVKNISSDKYRSEFIQGYLELPHNNKFPKGLIFLTHGLGGSTKRYGLRRIAQRFLEDGFAIFKLNLRGAGSGRYLSKNNYSARCSNDIISAVNFLKNNYFLSYTNWKNEKIFPPFFAVGLSLGGTILLNACLDYKNKNKLFDGIACVSTPIDLLSSSECIERSRNYFYQKWLINRLKKQVLESIVYENNNYERKEFINKKIKTIKEFDKFLTAPMWGYSSVEDYYFKASPIHRIKNEILKLPPTLLIHAKDDPWVPYKPTLELKDSLKDFNNCIQFLISEKGGHNGFHSPTGCWSDEVVVNWTNFYLNNAKKIT
tara:strand:- start:2826 stop:3917 length:1092 start_codon:yes stop_codon:yes gene_type:complete